MLNTKMIHRWGIMPKNQTPNFDTTTKHYKSKQENENNKSQRGVITLAVILFLMNILRNI